MRKLINFIPGKCKDIAFPERYLCKSEKEFYNNLNKNNGIKNRVYFSLYDCDSSRNFEGAEIHLIGLDLDSKDCLNNLVKLWKYCKEKNYCSFYSFSTKGFWCYIFTKNYLGLKNKSAALRYASEHIAQEVGLSIAPGEKGDLDSQVLGDIARISRLPNGYDVGRRRYCIPVTIEDMQKGYKFIQDKSTEQCFDFVYYNDGFFDISEFDRPMENGIDIGELENDIQVDNEVINDFFPCVKNCIVNTPLKSHNQYWVWTVIYLKELGVPVKAVEKLIRPYLEKCKREDGYGANDWIHFRVHDELPESIYRTEYTMPCCNKLIRAGYCKGKCKKYGGGNFPLYR